MVSRTVYSHWSIFTVSLAVGLYQSDKMVQLERKIPERPAIVPALVLTATLGYPPTPNIILLHQQPIYLCDRLLISTDRQSCYKLARSLHFFTSSLRTLRAHMLLRRTPDDSTRRRSTFVRLTSCALMAEVGRAPSVLVSRAVINVSMVWSNCRYLQQLGPSVIFSP